MDKPLLVSPKIAAELIGVCERTLWTLTAPRGPIRAMKIGKSVRYSPADLEKWVAESLSAVEA